MRGEDISLPSFLRDIAKAKYIPELAYYGLHLLCSPFHGTEDKVQVKQNLYHPHSIMEKECLLLSFSTCHFYLYGFCFSLQFPSLCHLCWVRAKMLVFFFHPSPYSLWLLCAALVYNESYALLTLMTNGLKTRESCSATGSLNLREENSRWLPVPGML